MALVQGKMLLMKLSLVLLAAATILLAAAANKPLPPPQAKPNCLDRCGNLTIPYPFGIGEGCYIPLKGQEKQFELTCDNSTQPPSLNWTSSKVRVTDFFLAEGELQVMNQISKDCYDDSGNNVEKFNPGLYMNPPFSISGPKNRFVGVGCDTYAVFRGFRGHEEFMTGCMSVCLNISTVDKSSNCSGVGCCQTTIPDGLKNRTVTLGSYFGHKDIWNVNPCSYAFLVQVDYFNFSGTRSFEELKNIEQIPMIFNWQIGNETCEVAQTNTVDYACKANSACVNQTKGPYPGYYCRCLPGYEGNPYIGCQDIDECAEINRCGDGTCQNTPGNYICKCNEGFQNDGQRKCIARPTANNTALKISLGICIGFSVLLVVIFGLYRECKKRQWNKMKKKYFEENGGQKLLLARQKESLTVQTFTEEELKKATKDYDQNEKIGEGGYGIVYKGMLDERAVAIKISKISEQNNKIKMSNESDQFINEVIILSRISHKNVVRLLGCCLETETPMLVYEFVGNGSTLYDHIHKKKGQPLSFAQRLEIAAQTATALSYLHDFTTTKIVHGDVKAKNILLDENLTAKVSDFGASKLVPDDKAQLSTLLQGTIGYLDPEYLQTNTLTDKSDVYSFGVVLVELLTGKNAVRYDKPENERFLANVFVSTFHKDPLEPILDDEIVKDGNWKIIEKVAELAEKCLHVKGCERPAMEYVREELQKILKTLVKQPGGKTLHESSSKDIDPSLESHSDAYKVEISDEGDGGSIGIISSAEYDASMQNQAQKPSGYGR